MWMLNFLEKVNGSQKMKPRCDSIQRYLSDYIDCTLSDRQTVTVVNHLQSCPACCRELESLRRTEILLQNFYVEPDAPDGYHGLFWSQLQETIKQTTTRPTSWRTTWQSFAWKGQALLNEFADFCQSRLNIPIHWIRLSPLYAVRTLAMALIVFLGFQLFQFEDDPVQFGERQSPPALEHPIQLVQLQKNRELVNAHEKVPEITQALPEQFGHSTHKANLGVLRDDLDDIPTSFVSDSDTLKPVIADDNTSPDLLASAQLSNPASLRVREDFSLPLGIESPFPDKFERQNRQQDGFIEMLMNVPLRNLSIIEVYNSVKL